MSHKNDRKKNKKNLSRISNMSNISSLSIKKRKGEFILDSEDEEENVDSGSDQGTRRSILYI